MLSTVIFLAFVIFALILLRILLKLYVERQQQQLGSRFKTKMVVAFLGLSLVPVIFLFIFAYGLLNRTIDKWFSVPLDLIRQDSEELVRELEVQAAQRADHISSYLAQNEDMIRPWRTTKRRSWPVGDAGGGGRPGNRGRHVLRSLRTTSGPGRRPVARRRRRSQLLPADSCRLDSRPRA